MVGFGIRTSGGESGWGGRRVPTGGMSAVHALDPPLAAAPPRWRVNTSGDDEHDRLARAFRRREPGALEAVYARHAPVVFAFLVRALRDRGAAEDVLQETFTDAWRRAERYDPSRGALGTWLMVIARSRAVDHLRRPVPEPRDTSLPGVIAEVADAEPLVDDLIGRWRVAALLAELPEEEARVLRLRIHLGLSQAEIAERTGMPIGTVKTRTTRGLERLRALLDTEEHA